MSDWITVDREGLRQINERLLARRGFGMIAAELYQNVMDTDATECLFDIQKIEGQPRAQIIVRDNGPGFARLTDAWTMFAPSLKKDDPTKAGRFNIGEKVVLSFCHSATIATTSGTVEFDGDGRREFPRRKRTEGTKITLEIRCTNHQFNQLIEYMPKLIVREGLRLCVNGAEVEFPAYPFATWEETLPTEIGEDLRPSRRKTEVRVYEAKDGETPMLYELGIPVVETGDRWHVSIQQKVPLNTERDNVTPAFLREVRVSVVNNMHDQLTEEDTESTWVNEATSDDRCEDDAAETFRVKKYGEKSVAFDPTNPEANAVAMSEGYTIIPSRGLTGGQRTNLKGAGTLRSSSEQYPTAGKGAYSDDPNAPPVYVLEDDELTDGMKKVRKYAEDLGKSLMGATIAVRFVKGPTRFQRESWAAAYGGRQLDFNVANLGMQWCDEKGAVGTRRLDELIIHEFGHHYESNHFSSNYHEALCMLGAKLKAVALKEAKNGLVEY